MAAFVSHNILDVEKVRESFKKYRRFIIENPELINKDNIYKHYRDLIRETASNHEYNIIRHYCVFAMQILAFIPTSVVCEQKFSIKNIIKSKLRSNMKEDLIKSYMYINSLEKEDRNNIFSRLSSTLAR